MKLSAGFFLYESGESSASVFSFYKGLKSAFFFAFVFLLSENAFSQSPPWAWASGIHSNASEWINDIAVDTSTGDVVTVGVFNSDLSAFYGSSFSGASGGAFVAKHDANGNVLWAFRIGNNQDDAANSVVTDGSGNIYVTGYLQNLADLKGTLSTPSTTFTSFGGKDMWVAKYNSAGQLLWAQQGGGTLDDEGKGICINSGKVFVTGYYSNTATFGSLSPFSPSANENAFVVAYDINGTEQWMADAGAATDAFGNDVTADENFVYITGDFRGVSLVVNNASGANSATLTNTTPAKFDAFMASWSVSGAFNWAGSIESNGNDYGHSICKGLNGVFVTGSAESSINFPSYASNPITTTGGNLDFFVARINELTGATVWAKCESGGGGDDEGRSIAVEKNKGEIYLAGHYKNSLSFSGGNSLPNAGGSEDVFIVSYDTNGVFKWSQSAGASGKDLAYAIATNYQGAIYVAGEYADNAVFGSTTLTNNGSSNIFLAKMGCEVLTNNFISADQTICQGTAPASLNGTLPAGGNLPYTYLWEESTDNISWSNATGTNNLQNYSPPVLATSTYFRRKVYSASGCADTSWSLSVFINVNPLPSASMAGTDQQLCNNNFSLNAGIPSSGTGDWSILTSGVSLSSTTSPTASSTSFVYGQNVFVWVVSSGVCPDSKDTVIITVDTLPSAALAGTDQSICSTSATLAATTPLIGNGLWTIFSGSVSFGNSAAAASPLTAIATGNNTLVWTITNGVCPPIHDTVIITGLPIPSAAIAGNDSSVCNTNFSLNANTPTTGSGTWNVLTTGTTLSSSIIPNPSSLSFNAGVNVFEWVISNGICPDERDTVIITVDLPPTPAVAGTDQTFCGSNSTLSATSPATGTGLWTVVSGTAAFANSSSPVSAVSAIAAGANNLVWAVSNGSCPASTDTIILFSFSTPTPSNAGPDQTLCSGSAFFAANNPSSGIGNWSVVSSSAIISNSTINTSAVNFLSPGANVFEWEISNGICPPSKDTVVIFVDQNPDAANAGIDFSVCGDSVVLNANAPLIGNGIWTVNSGSGTFGNAVTPASTVDLMSNGTNSFIWTISNGVCPPNKDTVIITSFSNPSASAAGNDTSICAASLVLSANTPLVGNGTWSAITGGANVQSANNPNSLVTALAIGQNTFEWIISNGVCPVSRDTVIISVDDFPDAANAGSDLQVCGDSASLNANTPLVGNGNWSVVFGSGTFSSATSPTANINSAAYGLNTLVWLISNGVCPPSADTLQLVCNQNPSSSFAGNDTTICLSSVSLTLNANVPLVGNGQWNIVTIGPSLSSVNIENPVAGNLITGANYFEWVISNGACASSRDTVIINTNTVPSTALAGIDDTICGYTTTLSANTPASGTGIWTASTGGINFSNPTLSTAAVLGLAGGPNSLIWTISNGVCPASSDTVIIFSDSIPTIANAGNDITLCNSTFVLSANTPLIGTGQWNVLSVGASITSPTSPNSGITSLINGLNIFEWVISNGVCPPSRDTMVIAIDSFPSNAVCGPDQMICGLNTTLSANTPNTGTGMWSVFSGAGTFANPTLAGTSVSNLGNGTNTFIWTTSNGQCPSSHDTVVITSYATPDVAASIADFSVCAGSCTLGANTPVIGTGVWTCNDPGVNLSNVNASACPATALPPGQTVFVWTISNGVCPADSDSLVVTRDLPPTTAVAGADIATELNSIQVSANIPVTGTGSWIFVSGSGSFDNASSNTTFVNGLSEGTTIIAWTISNGACPVSTDSLVLRIDGLFIPQIITPNGDNKNEIFEIKAYSGISGMHVEIVNRWGQTVFKRDDYKNDFRGVTDSGDDLPDDTYFYVLKTPSEKIYKGYLEIKRK